MNPLERQAYCILVVVEGGEMRDSDDGGGGTLSFIDK